MPLIRYYDEETDGIVYRVTPEAPSYDSDSISDITSETESSASGVTISSDDVSDYFVESHGRQQPANKNALRWFPADNAKRQILRHVIRKYLIGHNYVGPVRTILRQDAMKKTHHALEIGTRDGTWTQEMASEFPHVQFRSLDLVPMIPHPPRANIVFEVYDITEGLLLEDNSQDVVFINIGIELVSLRHMEIPRRVLSMTAPNEKVKNYCALLREVYRVLRPGGLVHIHEYAPGLWDSEDDSKFARKTNPIGCRHFDLVRGAIKEYGVDPDMFEKLPLWLAPRSDLWTGPDAAGGFEQIHTVVRTYPAYPHDGYPCSSKIDPRYRELLGHLSVVSTQESWGLLREAGLSSEEAHSQIEAAIEEFRNPGKCALLKVYTIYATKCG